MRAPPAQAKQQWRAERQIARDAHTQREEMNDVELETLNFSDIFNDFKSQENHNVVQRRAHECTGDIMLFDSLSLFSNGIQHNLSVARTIAPAL